MKLLILPILFVLFSVNATYASCDKSNIIIKREFSLTSLFSSDEDEEASSTSLNLNIPVRTVSGDGCFSIKSHLNLKVEIDADSSEYELEVFPMVGKADNVDQFHHKNLIRFVDNDKLDEVKVSVLSFACSGRDILAVESYQGKLRDIYRDRLKLKSAQVTSSTFFATGAAAKIIKQRQAELLTQDLKADFLPEEDISLLSSEKYLVKPSIPEVVAFATTTGRHTQLNHSVFTYQDKVVNGCDPVVYEAFKKYSVEEFLSSHSNRRNLKIKTKGDRIIIQKKI